MNDDFKGCLVEFSRLALIILAVIFGIAGFIQMETGDDFETGLFLWVLCGVCSLIVGYAYKKYDQNEEDKEKGVSYAAISEEIRGAFTAVIVPTDHS